MPETYHHGVRVVEINNGTRPIASIATAIIGMVCTGPDANATAFPLDTPVLITDVQGAIAKAGDTGTLPVCLEAIAAQTRAVVVVVRVAIDPEFAQPEGELEIELAGDDEVIGTVDSEGNRTGMQALLSAKALLGVTPRIIGCPGLESPAVIAAMATLAPKLRAMAYSALPGSVKTVAQAITFRNSQSARELMLLWPNWRAYSPTREQKIIAPAAAYALGLRAKIDQEQGWHKTLSNVPVSNVLGISRDVFWDLQTPGTDADLLNAACVTTLIQATGFRFWGSRTCSDDPLFAFESYTRTAQVLADSIADAMLWASDKPLHPSLARDIIETINAKLRQLRAEGYILDGSAWYDEEVNTTDTLKSGKLQISYDYTPLPPLEDLTLRQHITDTYWADFANRIQA